MDAQKINQKYKGLVLSGVAMALLLAISINMVVAKMDVPSLAVNLPAWTAMVLFIVYLYFLASLAKLLGKSDVLWVVITILLFPLGFFLSFITMAVSAHAAK